MRTIFTFLMCICTIGANAQCLSGKFGGTEFTSGVPSSGILTATVIPWLKFDDNFTIQTWVKFDNAHPVKEMVFHYKKDGYSGSDVILIYNENGIITANVGSSTLTDSADVLTDGTWVHIEVVRDTTLAKTYLFVNGYIRDSANCSPIQLGNANCNLVSGSEYIVGMYVDNIGGLGNKLHGYINTFKISSLAENHNNFTPECLLSDTTLPYNTSLYLNFNGKLTSRYNNGGSPTNITLPDTLTLSTCLPCDTSSTIIDTALSVNIISDKSIQVYPNPSREKFIVTLPTSTPTDAVVTDMVGRIVRELTIVKNAEISNLPAGMYIILIGAKKLIIIKQ